MSRTLLLVIVALALASTTSVAARGKKVRLEIHSTPEGALLSDGTTTWGYTPVMLEVTPTDRKFRACVNTSPFTVRWPSGASASVSWLSLCPAVGTRQTFTFDRPTGVDGLEIDLQFAFQRELLARMDAAAAAQASADAWAAAAARVPATYRRPVRCTSILSGRVVFTNCT